jgi:hypothetical protein
MLEKFNHAVIQSLAAVFALLISFAAAWFAWEQVNLSKIHNRLSVMPILQLTPYLEGKNGKDGKIARNGLYLSNDGLGPAIIKSFTVKSGGVIATGFTSDRWHEIISTTAANPTCFATGWPKAETALKAGVDIPLVSVTAAVGLSEICNLELLKLVGGNAIEVDMDYESMYGEKKHLLANSKVFSKTLDDLYKLLMKS